MLRFAWVLLAGLVLAAVSVQDAAAQKKTKVEIGMKWSGSVDDEKARKPDAITSPEQLKAVWKEWKVTDKMPEVDFKKNIVVAVYSVGSKLNIAGANLDDKGNLDVLGFGTRDIRPGFRFVLGVVSKDGVKTVGGKELPKE